jgi:hypothetical protein
MELLILSKFIFLISAIIIAAKFIFTKKIAEKFQVFYLLITAILIIMLITSEIKFTYLLDLSIAFISVKLLVIILLLNVKRD